MGESCRSYVVSLSCCKSGVRVEIGVYRRAVFGKASTVVLKGGFIVSN